MLKKLINPTNNTFSGVEFVLRGAKKRRAMAISNAVAVNAETGVQIKLQAVKQGLFNYVRMAESIMGGIKTAFYIFSLKNKYFMLLQYSRNGNVAESA